MPKKSVQTRLFETSARQKWRVGTYLNHFADGSESIYLVSTRIEPFQVVTFHLADLGASSVVDKPLLARFQDAMALGAGAEETRDVLRGVNR